MSHSDVGAYFSLEYVFNGSQITRRVPGINNLVKFEVQAKWPKIKLATKEVLSAQEDLVTPKQKQREQSRTGHMLKMLGT